jgi:glycosyltransferase involved in cell wall biosynthesis
VKNSSNKQFVTMYNRAMDIDILKPPGKIPYYVSKLSDGYFKSRLVTFTVDTYTSHRLLKDHLEFVAITPRSALDKKYLLSLLAYIARNAGSIDVLQLYHIRYGTLFKCLIYKLFNPKGFIYIKLDGEWTLRSCFPRPDRKGINRFVEIFRRWAIIMRGIVSLANLISVETLEIYDFLVAQNYKRLNRKLFLNPYGIDLKELQDNELPLIRKEKIIMTVGRIGTEQKNTEMLLTALGLIGTLDDWHVYIIGPIETGFNPKIIEFFNTYPNFRQNVHFTGNISNRRALCEYYQKSRCFVLTSRFESWGLPLTEAAYFKNYIVTTDVGCAKDLVIKEVFGSIVPQNDPEKLAQILRMIISDKIVLSDEDGKLLKKRCCENYSWEKVVNNLLIRLGEKGFECNIQKQTCLGA